MQTNNNKISQFNAWLSDYQEDLNKIVGKHKFNSHALDQGELVSEINLGILKSYEKLLNEKESPIETRLDFNKMAYSYARNYIKWTADGASNKDKKYIKKRKDGLVSSEDGEKTLFESVCETIGSEDSFFASLSESDKFQNLLSWILDYSHFLTPHQKNIFELILSGKNLDEIGELTGVSHQAISCISIEIFNKIKSNIKVKINDENSDKIKIKKGHSCVKELFGPERKNRAMNPKDLSLIKSTLANYPKKYSLKDLEGLLKKRYNSKQIAAYVNSQKYNKFLKVKK
jgi:RNA polymerase sigma factor (sigma-70 family)